MSTGDLDYFAGLAGVIGCGVCRPGGRTLARPGDGSWAALQVENFVARIAAASLSAREHGLPGTTHCWQFERAWAFCGVRADNVVLVLISSSNPENSIQLRATAESFANSSG